MKNKSTTSVTTSEESPPATISVRESLEQIRSEHLRIRNDAHDTITRLERWRDEIDATIAFLRAQRK
jgi:hypothetical protein